MANFLNLKAVLGLNASGFFTGLKQAGSASKRLSSEIKSEFAKAFGTAALLAFTKRIVDAADDLNDLSGRLSVSTQELQEWQYAAKKTGAKGEDVTRFFEKLADSKQEAMEGNEKAISSFRELGLSVDKLATMRIPQIGKMIGEAFRTDDAERLSAFLKNVGGDSARKLIPAFKEGLDGFAAEAKEAGYVWDTEVVAGLAAAKDQLEAFGDTLRGPVAQAVLYVARAMTGLFDSTQSAVGGAAAYWGAFTMDIDPSKDMTKWDYKKANERGLAAMNEAQARYQKLAEERERLLKENADRLANPSKPYAKPRDILHDFANDVFMKATAGPAAASAVQGDGLTSWQRAGAAVRQVAENRQLSQIIEFTKATARNTEAMMKDRGIVTGGNFGGGF